MSGNLVIVDPLTGEPVRVKPRNQLDVAATTESREVTEALHGNTFLATTGSVLLTSANYSHLLYIKNNEQIRWIINAISGTFGATDGAGDVFMQFTINPTGGTLLSATEFAPANLNFGSPNILTGDFRIGGEGGTVSGGFSAAPTLIPEGVPLRRFPGRPIILAPGSSMAIGIKPATGNTGMNIQIQVPLYREIT